LRRFEKRGHRKKLSMRVWLVLVAALPLLTVGSGASTAGNAAPSRNGLIAAVGNGGIYLVNPHSVATRLVSGTARADDYRWSPDGRMLAFDTGGGDDGYWTDSDVYTVRADGTELRRVLGDAWSPSWLPDSSGLVAMREVVTHQKVPGIPAFENSNVATYAFNADGTDPRRLTSFTEAGDDAFALSPDGKWIAYSSFSLNRVRLDGSGRGRVAGEGSVSEITWSPDGDWLAFVADDDNYLVRPDGSGLHRIGRAGDPFEHLVWSPNGLTIAAERQLDSEPWADVVLIDVETGKERRLTRTPMTTLAPAWSPEGKQLVFVAYDTESWCDLDELGELWVTNADATGLHRLARGCWGRPSWLSATPAPSAPRVTPRSKNNVPRFTSS
jgi:TolB protein